MQLRNLGEDSYMFQRFNNRLTADCGRILCAEANGETVNELDRDFPTAHDGLRGMALIQAVYNSAQVGSNCQTLQPS